MSTAGLCPNCEEHLAPDADNEGIECTNPECNFYAHYRTDETYINWLFGNPSMFAAAWG